MGYWSKRVHLHVLQVTPIMPPIPIGMPPYWGARGQHGLSWFDEYRVIFALDVDVQVPTWKIGRIVEVLDRWLCEKYACTPVGDSRVLRIDGGFDRVARTYVVAAETMRQWRLINE